LLLHLVDIAPIDTDADPAVAFKSIQGELKKFSTDLTDKPRWLVINKIDLLPEDDLAVAKELLLTELGWQGPIFMVSAETGKGTEELGQAVMRQLEEMEEEQMAAGES
jgi:GTP-binding protein